ncbi:MAG TPA: magnesium transporter, partial [Aestuariivirga sp.]
MLSAYGTDKGCLTEFPALTDAVPEGVVWVDMVEPTFDEEKVVEAALKIDIPTREELAEIEASSRLYQEDGAAFMTANLIRRGE